MYHWVEQLDGVASPTLAPCEILATESTCNSIAVPLHYGGLIKDIIFEMSVSPDISWSFKVRYFLP